jgi:ribosomal protein S27AE
MREYRAGRPGAETERYRTDPEFRMKARARNRVKMRVRRGAMTRMPCESCGTTKSQAHHDDYSKPLEVRWLCAKCHGRHHYPE